MATVCLLNDTGHSPHVGCLAVSDAHRLMLNRLGIDVVHTVESGRLNDLAHIPPEAQKAQLAADGLLDIFATVDGVVINGEGTIHHGAGQHLLCLVAWARAFERPVVVVNAVLQDCGPDVTRLALADDVTVRDEYSSRYLRELGIQHRVVPDSILEANFVETPCDSFAGKIVVTDGHWSRTDVTRTLRRFAAGLGHAAAHYPLRAEARRNDWRHAVANLRGADVVVTGRHHGVYLALMAGVPFVAFRSNSWKIEGLLAMLDPGLAVCRDRDDLTRACVAASRSGDRFRAYAERLQEARPLPTFEVLNRSLIRRSTGAR